MKELNEYSTLDEWRADLDYMTLDELDAYVTRLEVELGPHMTMLNDYELYTRKTYSPAEYLATGVPDYLGLRGYWAIHPSSLKSIKTIRASYHYGQCNA